jgi:hypothetical protein
LPKFWLTDQNLIHLAKKPIKAIAKILKTPKKFQKILANFCYFEELFGA